MKTRRFLKSLSLSFSRITTAAAFTVAASMIGCGDIADEPVDLAPEGGIESAAAPLSKHHPGRLIVKPKQGKASQMASMQAALGMKKSRRLSRSGIELVELQDPNTPMKEVIERYKSSGLFEYVEPDYEVTADIASNDPKYTDGSQWGLHNTGQSAGKVDADIDAPEAWDVKRTATDVVVAVIDSGIRLTHEDLAANLWVNSDEIAGNGIDDDANGYVDDRNGINAFAHTTAVDDDYGHGTHVAGTIGAVGNNGKGGSGVAWGVKLMPCKMLDANGNGSTTAAIECMDYAVNNGAQVVNASWKIPAFSQGLLDEITQARAAGVVVVCSAGNNGTDNDFTGLYPATYASDNIVSVAALDRLDALASFSMGGSNFGANTVHLGAPGKDIYSTLHSTNTSYGTMSGTSMAAPHVSGALALLKSKYPTDSYGKLIARVVGTTDAVSSLAGRTIYGGRLNLQRALTATLVADFAPSKFSGAPGLNVTFTDRSVGTISSRVWDFGDGTPTSTAVSPSHVFANPGTYKVKLTITDASGATSTRTRNIGIVANYAWKTVPYAWIDPSAHSTVSTQPSSDDGVSGALALPFTFSYYGQAYSSIYVGSNGLVGFGDASGLTVYENTDLPSSTKPDGFVAALWDDLVPEAGSTIRMGTVGTAPNRKVVVSFLNMPGYADSKPIYTFQTILHEGTNAITLQYQQVTPADTVNGGGRTATIGIESPSGLQAVRYSFNGSTPLTNNLAIQAAHLSAAAAVKVEAADPAAAKSAHLHRVFTDTSASGGSCAMLEATAVGGFVTYKVDGLQGGVTYDVVVRVKKANNRGIVKVFSQTDPASTTKSAQGSTTGYDMYSSTTAYANLPTIAYPVSGTGPQTRYLRFEVSGKNASSTSYWVPIDTITLTPR